MIFIPTKKEQELINAIQKIYNSEYVLIRLTPTMLKKSIIDASSLIRNLLRKNDIVDFNTILQGPENKIRKETTLIKGCNEYTILTSFYRPLTKKGDPRFWPASLKKHIFDGELLYITSFKNKLILVVLNDNLDLNFIKEKFASESILLKYEIIEKINVIREKGFVYSVSDKEKISPKDVGDTFEREMGIEPNSKPTADYKGQVELKAKRSSAKTKYSLFSQVPDWSKSKIKSTAELILKYGYTHSKRKDFLALYVTVTNKPNKQGLYLKVEEEDNNLVMYDSTNTSLCVWPFEAIEKKLLQKHPATLWILADEQFKNNQWYFKYTDAILTRNPIFTSFLNLIESGKISYDWRAEVKPDRTGYNDHGNGFRINPTYRTELFLEEEII